MSQTGAEAADPTPRGWTPRVWTPWRIYVLLILMAAYTCSYLDRSLIAVLLPQLKLEFHIDDKGLGVLSGLTFAVFYVLFGVPVAMLADRGNRRNLIAAAIVLWSAMTAACGLARSFIQLALARIGVGVGEAGLSPPAHSIISDLFPERTRATALSVYSFGTYLGILVGMAVGGHLAEAYGWRRTFFLMALPGLVVAALVLLSVREPMRGAGDAHAQGEADDRSFLDVLGVLWAAPAIRWTLIAMTLCSLFGQSQAAWLPSLLVRSHGLKLGQAGLIVGLSAGLGGGGGTLVGGVLSDRLGARDPRWRLWVVALAFLLQPIPQVLFLFAPTVALVAGAAIVNSFLFAIHLPPTSAVVQNLTPLRMRARAVAVTLFLISLLGGGVGPLMVGAISDALKPAAGANSLRDALAIITVFALAASVGYFVAGRKLAPARGAGATGIGP